MQINNNPQINIRETFTTLKFAGHLIATRQYIAYRSSRTMTLTLLLMLLSISSLFAQGGTLKGVVADKGTGENIPFSTVAVIKTEEQDAFTGGVSDENGSFLIEEVPFGTYKLMISFIGYKTGEISEFTLSPENDNIDFGTIEIEPEVIGIEMVEVLAASRTSVNKADRRTYNVADFETARGGTAADILSKLPSVNVDGEQEITVRGSSDFVVYFNGKPSNTTPSMLLSQIPGENIQSIDIITVPSSAFEAQGMGGIININTKSNTSTGLTVSASGMIGGTPWKDGTDVYTNHKLTNNRINGGLNLFYNKDKLGLYATVNYTERHNKGIFDVYTSIYQDETQPLSRFLLYPYRNGGTPQMG